MDKLISIPKFLNKISSLKLYILSFLLMIGYSLSIARLIAPDPLFNTSSLSLFAFSDLYFTILSSSSIITLPLFLLYMLNYKSIKTSLRTTNNHNRIVICTICRVSVYIFLTFVAILIAYFLSNGRNIINLGFTDRSSLQFILSPFNALLLSQIFLVSYFISFTLLAFIIELLVHSSWKAIVIILSLSYLDTGIRLLFNSTQLMGILPSDNTIVFYFKDNLYGITRPSYVYSLIYWFAMLIVLYFVFRFFIRKNTSDKEACL